MKIINQGRDYPKSRLWSQQVTRTMKQEASKLQLSGSSPFSPPIIIDCDIEVKKVIDKDGNTKYKQFGDCDVDLYNKVYNITPRIKGMGIMTVASLMENVMEAYNIIHG